MNESRVRRCRYEMRREEVCAFGCLGSATEGGVSLAAVKVYLRVKSPKPASFLQSLGPLSPRPLRPRVNVSGI